MFLFQFKYFKSKSGTPALWKKISFFKKNYFKLKHWNRSKSVKTNISSTFAIKLTERSDHWFSVYSMNHIFSMNFFPWIIYRCKRDSITVILELKLLTHDVINKKMGPNNYTDSCPFKRSVSISGVKNRSNTKLKYLPKIYLLNIRL